MNKVVKKQMEFAGRTLTLETGKLAQQANMSVLASWGETMVLVATVSAKPKNEVDFLPLTVSYEEKLYAGGLIKSSRWVKREGAPTDQARIAGRLIDHAIRPLFPKDYQDEVNVIATVLSVDKMSDPEVLSMIAASACLHSSDIPWKGPMVSSRVGMTSSGEFILNPSEEQLGQSDLDLVVSLVEGKFLAMEAGCNIIPEEKIVEAVNFVNDQTQELHDFIEGFSKEVEKDKYVYVSKALAPELVTDVKNLVGQKIREMMAKNLEKTEMQEEESLLLEEVFAKFEGKHSKNDMTRAFSKLETDEMRHLILDEGKRPDGRSVEQVRPISVEIGILPRTHGSALFTRGITQGLSVVTLGSSSMEQLIQTMYGEESKRYMHHYNMPQYSVGEMAKGRGGPNAREIGHGMLAERALIPVVPEKALFPYTIRVVSEILSSSGSSSMAATCGSSLALMDAGVPIKAPVAGIAIGVMTDEEETKYVLITDMAYKEDAYGFMDFKMTGTRQGVTAIQVDIKLPGIPLKLLPTIVTQSRKARLEILDAMDLHISASREQLSQHAPRMTTIKIKPDQIGLVFGSGGKTIRDIESKTGSTLGIDEDGLVSITGNNADGVEQARKYVDGLTRQVELGEIYDATVKRIVDFGAFVEILPGKEGLVHVSELAYGFVRNVRDIVKEGDVIKVQVLDVDPMGKISLSKKALEERPANGENGGEPPYRPDDFSGRRFERRPFSPNRGGGSRGGFDKHSGRAGRSYRSS